MKSSQQLAWAKDLVSRPAAPKSITRKVGLGAAVLFELCFYFMQSEEEQALPTMEQRVYCTPQDVPTGTRRQAQRFPAHPGTSAQVVP